MILSPSKVAFGRHESFALRYGWLTKGFQAFTDNGDIFSTPDSIVTLGVGKNMVNSIRHWLRATRLIGIPSDPKKPTPLGLDIFSENGWDPYLEDEATIWLVHWLLASNPQHATTWYWFFNRFHKPEFSSLEVTSSLASFAKEQLTVKSPSATTLKGDVAVLLRMYVQKNSNRKITLEEALDSPLSLLNLVTYSPLTKVYQSKLTQRDELPLGILGFAITELFNENDQSEIPIEDLMYSKDGQVAPGLVFRLSEIALLTKLEQLVQYIPGIYEIRETAGIHQMYMLKEIDARDYLAVHYETQQKQDEAA
jgi:hypothetical protein